MATYTERIKLLEAELGLVRAQQAIVTEALRQLIEGNWTESMPHAAAYIASLYGPIPPSDFNPQPFPNPKGDGAEPAPQPPAIPITQYPTPNFWAGRPAGPPIAIVLHTMVGSLVGTDSWFANPNSQVSSHYGVNLNGEVHQYVPLENCAWANGVLEQGHRWPGPRGTNPNSLTVSIETEDLGSAAQSVSDAMFTSVLDLCVLAAERYPSIRYLLGHSAISSVSRANCPGQRWTSGRVQTLAATLGLELVL